MDKNALKRWRPVIETLFHNLTRQEAIDATLLLLEAPGQKTMVVITQAEEKKPEAPAEKKPEPQPPRRRVQLRAVPDMKHDPPDTDEEKAPVDPEAFFTIEESAQFIGIGRDRMYQLLRGNPEKFPYRQEAGRRGRYRILGRALNAFRLERLKAKKRAAQVSASDLNNEKTARPE